MFAKLDYVFSEYIIIYVTYSFRICINNSFDIFIPARLFMIDSIVFDRAIRNFYSAE